MSKLSGRLLRIVLCILLLATHVAAQEGDAVEVTPAPTYPQPPAIEEASSDELAGSTDDAAGVNTAESLGAARGATLPEGAGIAPASQPTIVAPQLPPGSGTASSVTGVAAQPQIGTAGNAADSRRPAPGGRGSGPTNAAEGSVNGVGQDPAAGSVRDSGIPPDLKSDESLFSEDDMKELLPGFAQGQSGEVSGNPGSLMTGQAVQGFETLLGASELPEGEFSFLNSQRLANPGMELETNFGRLIVPPTGTISGSTETKQFQVLGGLTVYYDQVVIKADSADIDEKQEIAVLKGNVTIDDPKYSMTTDELRIRFEDKLFQATGFVQFKKLADATKSRPNLGLPKKDRLREYFAGQQFELYCMDLHYNWETKELVALESVRMVHPSFAGTMDRVDYNDKTKQYVIDGNVSLDVSKYDWIFENELTGKEDEEKIRAITEKPTQITCNRLLYSEETALAQFYALPGKQVLFDQTDRKIAGAFIEINDMTKDFHVEGTTGTPLTFDQTNGEWLMAGGVIKRDEASTELKEVLAKALNATAQRLTYNFDRKRLEMTGGVKMTTEGKLLQADAITQDETAKFFLMQGNVLIQPDADSSVYAAQVYLDTANDVVSFVGLVQGSFKNSDLAVNNTGATNGQEGDAGAQTPSGLFQNTGFAQPSDGQRGGSGLQPGGDPGANVAEGG